jgi:hypothetical protein
MKPIDSGTLVLVEECRRIDFGVLNRKVRAKLLEALLTAEIQSLGYDLKLSTSKTGYGGLRYWFACPVCSRRKRVLYVHPVMQVVGCRKCLGLKYRSQRFKGMVENSK